MAAENRQPCKRGSQGDLPPGVLMGWGNLDWGNRPLPKRPSPGHVPPRFGRGVHRVHRQLGCGLMGMVCVALSLASACADGPDDNHPAKVRPIPRPGIEVPTELRRQLEEGLQQLGQQIKQLKLSEDAEVVGLVPDVEIFYRAVHDALTYNEFFAEREFEAAQRLLAQGQQRARDLAAGQADWTRQTGLVVRGFVSKLDGSVQPYGLVIPPAYDFAGTAPMALDLWFHGRGETLSEVNFLTQQQSNPGVFQPRDAIVLHPYGRYSNANKFAGEIDVFEALAAAQQHYRVDAERIAVRGFSMGGASTWQLAVHYPGRWVAANPGAGFSETPDFLQTFQHETLSPYWWEKKLWRWYDATDWAGNLRHCPTIAYSGELDRQKQAADMMGRALQRQGLGLVHLIGPQTEHRYEPQTAIEVERRIRTLSRQGRERLPHEIEFSTYTLRYPRMGWVEIQALEQHWEAGTIRAELGRDEIRIQVEGITAFKLQFDTGQFPFRREPTIRIRYQDHGEWRESILGGAEENLPVTGLLPTDRSWSAEFHRGPQRWQVGPPPEGLRKAPGLQGPIDDAFMDSFLFVRPTGTTPRAQVQEWAASEMQRAIEHWRRHFRGHVRIKDDVDVTADDLERHHLILWGDPSSNQLWQRIAEQLPIRLHAGQWTVGDQRFDAEQTAPVMIYPNPLNPARYLVTNSSFTFREYAYLNNARQVPMLPDWAIIDLSEPANTVWPGKVLAADFFDERWQVKLPIPEPVKVEPPQPYSAEAR